MQGIGEVKPFLIPPETLSNSLWIFRLHIGNAKQLLERLGYDFPSDKLAVPQYTLRFNQHRFGDKYIVVLHYTKSPLGLQRVIIGQ